MDKARLPPTEKLEAILCNVSEPIAKRMRALFYLKEHGTTEAVLSVTRGEMTHAP